MFSQHVETVCTGHPVFEIARVRQELQILREQRDVSQLTPPTPHTLRERGGGREGGGEREAGGGAERGIESEREGASVRGGRRERGGGACHALGRGQGERETAEAGGEEGAGHYAYTSKKTKRTPLKLLLLPGTGTRKSTRHFFFFVSANLLLVFLPSFFFPPHSLLQAVEGKKC
jgi:hypothetical protein